MLIGRIVRINNALTYMGGFYSMLSIFIRPIMRIMWIIWGNLSFMVVLRWRPAIKGVGEFTRWKPPHESVCAQVWIKFTWWTLNCRLALNLILAAQLKGHLVRKWENRTRNYNWIAVSQGAMVGGRSSARLVHLHHQGTGSAVPRNRLTYWSLKGKVYPAF